MIFFVLFMLMDASSNSFKDKYALDLGSLSDHNISKIFSILHPSSQAESITDLNLGFGFVYYAFVRVLRPKLVVVLGSQIGFSAVCLALGVKDNENGGRVILIDAGYSDQTDGKAKGMGGIGFWNNSAKYNAVFKKFDVENTIDVKLMRTAEFAEIYVKDQMLAIDLLMIDADHSFEGFKFDFEKFSSFVRDDGLILCHDVLVEYGWGGYPFGVKNYFEEVLQKGDYQNLAIGIWPGLGIIRKAKKEQRYAEGLVQKIDRLEQELFEKDQSISELRREIDEMDRSIVWQMMKFHNGFVERALPQGTGRRRIYDQILELGRAMVN